MILSPVSPRTQTVARVWPADRAVLCSFREHDERFRVVVKRAGLSWSENSRAWKRILDVSTNGAPGDRAAELATDLVGGGFMVDIDDAIGEAVQSASWKPEIKRWVMAFDGKFHLRWKGSDENLYWRAKSLPGAEYDSERKTVAIPPVYFSEVIGFAEEHDFEFSPAANALELEARENYARVILPELPERPARQKRKLGERLYDLKKFTDLPYREFRLKTRLLPHQVPAVEYVSPRTVAGLFMDMGTGKTRCAIELVYRRRKRISKVVWFCPVSLKLTIAAEIEKHTEGESIFIFDDEVTHRTLPNAFWNIVGIESMSASDRVVLAVRALIDESTFVIVDESTYIKGHSATRTLRITQLSQIARYRLALTGTPLTQGVEDLYAQMRFLSPDILGYGSFYSFANNHLEYSEKFPGMVVRGLQVDRLAEKIAPFVYQVTKAECLDLPEKLYDQVYFGLTNKQAEVYVQAKTEILAEYDESRELDSWVIFKLFTALQQIVSGFWTRTDEFLRFPHRRIETLLEVLTGLPQGEKVIIWCKYVESVNQIAEALPGCARYFGELNEHQRNAELVRFRGDGCQYLVATQATGGHGLTLNEAHYHVFYENEFKYSHRIQAEDRSHRIGQANPVTYIDIVSNSGIDQRIQKALAKKEDVVKAFQREINKTNIRSL